MAAIAAGCSSVSDMLEKLGSGELAVIASDAIALDPVQPKQSAPHTASSPTTPQSSSTLPQHIHIHTPATAAPAVKLDTEDDDDEPIKLSDISIPRLAITALCAAIIVGSLLYIADRIIAITSDAIRPKESVNVEDIVTPTTGEVVAGFEVTDEYGIRPFHPVTGQPNVPHNGVDLATPIGTPIYAVGKTGDETNVRCWWDVDGGGWVVNQTAESFPGYVFQSLHMSENGCRQGKSKAGEVIAYSGNSGLGTGEHYDFRVKINGEYVPPATKYLEAAITGEPPKEN